MAPESKLSHHFRAIGMLLVADMFAALGFPLVKALALVHEGLFPSGRGWFEVADLTGPRFLLPIPLLWWWQYREGRVTAREWLQGGAIGLFASVGMIVLSDGLRFATASTSAFFATLYAVFIPVWIALWRRRMPGPLVWISCLMVLTGVAILGRFDWRELRFGRGEFEALLSAGFFMGQLLSLDHEGFRGNRPRAITLAMFVTMSAVFAAVTAASAPDLRSLAVPWTSPSWVALTLVLSAACTLAPCLMVNIWQPRVTATEAGLIYAVEPVMNAVLVLFIPAWLSCWTGIGYPNESATLGLLVGGGLITAANVLVQSRRAAAPSSPPP